jgi:exopolysaccharide production protein ExoQ
VPNLQPILPTRLARHVARRNALAERRRDDRRQGQALDERTAQDAATLQQAERASARQAILVWPLSWLDQAFVILFLTLVSGTMIPLLADYLVPSGNLPKWPFFLTLYAIGGLMAVQRGRLTWAGIRGNPAIWYLALLPLVSVVWSVLPSETITSSLTLIGPMLFAVVLASAISKEDALRLFAMASAVIVAANWAAIVAVPAIGIQPDGPWAGTPRGFHAQKNGLGSTAMLAMTILATYAVADPRGRRMWVGCAFAAGVGLLVVARSTTTIVLAIFGFAILFAPRFALKLGTLLFPVLIGALGGLFVFAPEITGKLLAALTPLVGKDATMSNRLPIWQVLMPYIEASPWFGYGYGVFWHESISPALIFERRLGFDPGSAHNGVIEVWLALGAVGVFALTLALIQFFIVAGRALALLGATPIVRLALATGILQVVHNVTESSFLSRNDLEWMVFIWLWATLGMLVAQAQSLRQTR